MRLRAYYDAVIMDRYLSLPFNITAFEIDIRHLYDDTSIFARTA